MTQQMINVGSFLNDPSADEDRSAWIKVNANFSDIYQGGITVTVPTTGQTYPLSYLAALEQADAAAIAAMPTAINNAIDAALVTLPAGNGSALRVTPTGGGTPISLGDLLVLINAQAVTIAGLPAVASAAIAAYIASGIPYDYQISIIGQPAAGQTLVRTVFARAVAFPSSLAASQAYCLVAPTSTWTANIRQNGAVVATVSFAAGATTGTFVTTGFTTFAGSLVELDAPSAADPSIADIAITLVGTR